MKSMYLNEPYPYRIFEGKNIGFYAHYHQQVEIVYCIEGNVNLLVDGIEYNLKCGDVAVIFPNQRHYYPHSDEGNRVYILLFYPDNAKNFYWQWLTKIPASAVIKKEMLPEFMGDLFKQFVTVYASNKDISLFEAYTSLIAAHLLPLIKLDSVNISLSSEQDELQIVLNYINQHFKEDITQTRVSKDLGISVNAISKLFSNVMNCSFMSYVNSLRITHAKSLLRSTNYTINEIAFLSGFQSRRAFFRNFMAVCEETPKQYRDRKRK